MNYHMLLALVQQEIQKCRDQLSRLYNDIDQLTELEYELEQRIPPPFVVSTGTGDNENGHS